MKHRILALSLCCLLATPAPGRAQEQEEPPAKALPPQTKVTLAQAGDSFLYLPIYVAMAEGLFAGRGLDVTVVDTGNDNNTLAALVAHTAQFGIADPTYMVTDRVRPANGRVIAAVVTGIPLWGVAKPAVPVITSDDQLKTYSVGVYPAPSAANTLQEEMFLGGGLVPNIKSAPYASLLPMLDAGQIDIALDMEPDVSQAIAHGDHIVYSMARRSPDLVSIGIEVTTDELKDPPTVQKFISAIYDTQRFIRANPYKTVQDLQAHFPSLGRGVVQNATMRMLSEGLIAETPVISEAGWKNAVAMRVAAGELPSVDLASDNLDNAWAQRAFTSP